MFKKEKNLDLQTELFEEWQEQKSFQKKQEGGDSLKSFFDYALLKRTKVSFSYDTLLFLFLMFVFVLLTFFLLGFHYGKSIQKRTIVTIEKTPEHIASLGVSSSQKIESFAPDKKSVIQEFFKQENKSKPASLLSKKKKVQKNPPKTFLPKPSQKRMINTIYRYTIQIAASCDLDASEKDIQKIQKKGYNSSFIVPYVSSNGTKWYKLCIGRFKRMKTARLFMNRFQKKEGRKSCFITNL